MTELAIPDLTFPGNSYGERETPWDLRPLIHRGGAGTYVSKVAHLIAKGKLGSPIVDRIPLVERFHDYLTGRLAGGSSRAMIKMTIAVLRNFYTWIDDNGRSATLESIENSYLDYTEHLIHRLRVLRNIAEPSARTYATMLSKLLSEVLQLKVGVLVKSRLPKGRARKRVLGTQADKQNLEHMTTFGHFLLDITDALTVEAIRGTLPVTIRFRSGKVLEEWCYLHRRSNVKPLSQLRRRRTYAETDTSSRTRHPIINLRLEAELLIFIAQTGMNLEQAETLKIGTFRYQSHLDGYHVYRVYKGRRGGEVEFEIYSEYRALFERYLQWREVFASADDDRLFPFVPVRGKSSTSVSFQAIQKRCTRLDLLCYRPRKLRNIRLNWILRRSRDPHLTAEMAQHSEETLLRVYDQPHHQVSAIEISRFLSATDPAIAKAMPGPGICAGGAPRPGPDSHLHVATPDCINPAGCLFCDHHRDIDSEDHVWSLATYRHFKSIELAQYRPSANSATTHPAKAAIDRIAAKLKHFAASSEVREFWVREALARIEESEYHPKWQGFLQLMELQV